jgi:hypothetical protein
VLFIFLTYWIHFELRLRNPLSFAWLPQWFQCLQQGNGQQFCATQPGGPLQYMPSFGSYAFSEVVVNLTGSGPSHAPTAAPARR